MKTRLLLIAVLLGACIASADEPVFTWVGRDGVVHFTNERAALPKSGVARPTRGGEITVVHTDRAPANAPAKPRQLSPEPSAPPP